jgi:hypothetical protein
MSNGIGPNPLNPLSKIYLEQIVEKKDDSYLEPDMKKRQKNNEKARKDMEKMGTSMKNPHFEEKQQGWDAVNSLTNVYKNMSKGTDVEEGMHRDAKTGEVVDKAEVGKTYYPNMPKKKTSVALRKEKMKEGLDPVGKEDGDVNNDGKKDSTDSYLMKRRKAIGKAMKKKMTEGVRDLDPEKGTAERKARLEKKRGMKVDDHPQYKKEEVENVEEGKFTGSKSHIQRDGTASAPARTAAERKKDRRILAGYGKGGMEMAVDRAKKERDERRAARIKESFSSWRQDLSEIMTDDIDSKPIKEKKVNNKIKINPKLGEAVEEMGGELIEMTEISEFEFMVEGLRQELVDEGHDPEAVDYALEEAKVTMGHDTEAPARERTRDKLKKKAKGLLGKMAYKGYHAARDAKRAASPMVQRVKTSAKRGIRKAALKVADKLKEETVDEAVYGGTPPEKKDTRMTVTAADKKGNTPAYQRYKAGDKRYKAADHMGEEMSPQEIALQKKKAMLDKMIATKRMQGLKKSASAEPAKAMGEETEDSLRDRRMERGGVDGNTNYKKPAPKFAPGPSKKKYDGMSALDMVKAEIRKKHGKGAIVDTKKK